MKSISIQTLVVVSCITFLSLSCQAVTSPPVSPTSPPEPTSKSISVTTQEKTSAPDPIVSSIPKQMPTASPVNVEQLTPTPQPITSPQLPISTAPTTPVFDEKKNQSEQQSLTSPISTESAIAQTLDVPSFADISDFPTETEELIKKETSEETDETEIDEEIPDDEEDEWEEEFVEEWVDEETPLEPGDEVIEEIEVEE